MAADSNAFLDRRILDRLLEVYHVSATRKLQCDGIIKDCRKLFQSWPQESKEKKPHEHEDQSATGNTLLEGDTTKQVMSTSESAALDLADKALVQAQRMRCKQAKLIEKESSLNKGTSNQAHSPERNETENKNPQSTNFVGSLPTRTSSSVTAVSGSKSASKKQPSSAGQRQIKETRFSHTQKMPSGSHDHVEGKLTGRRGQLKGGAVRSNLSGKSDTRGTTATGKQPDLKAPVGLISQSSLKRVLGQCSSAGKSRYMPVHTTAPFKTDPSLSRPGGSGKGTRTNVPVHRTDKQKHHSLKPTTSQQNVQDFTGQKSTKSLPCRASNFNRDSEPSGALPDVNVEERQPAVTEQLILSDMENLVLDKDIPMPRTKDLQNSQNLNGHDEQACQIEKSAPFNLLRDGGSLTVPVKLHRAIASNRKLRQQVQTSAVTVHAKEGNSSVGVFLEKLTAHFNSQEADTGNIFKMVVQMTAFYKCYSLLMSKYQRVDLQESSSWQDVLRAKRTMENICLAFADMEENYNHILDCIGQGIDEKRQLKVVSPSWEAQPSILWLPQRFSAGYLPIPRTMKYRKVSEIERYHSFVHQLQLLQLHSHLIDMCETTLLPLLTSMGSSHRLFAMLYRATYSLLCSSGGHLPMVVADEDEDDATSPSES